MPNFKAAHRDVFRNQESFATTLITVFVDNYKTEGFTWSPETIEMEINDDFEIRIPRPNMDRLLTAINLITSDDFYKSLPDFINYCNILSGDTYDPRNWDPATAVEVAWGVTEGVLLSPPDDNDENPFTEEIVSYIGKVLDDEGIITAPDILRIATRENPATFVNAEFSDDPLMYNSIYDLEASKTDAINAAVKQGLAALSQQLSVLPLKGGSAAGAVTNMLNSLN